MSYLVLARKWRPQTFSDLVGQEHVRRTLQNAIDSGRVAHAFLFTGARGVGKTTSARILAKALNCETGMSPEPCNSCPACSEITTGNSVDVLEIDGASNTGVDDVRELRETIKYLPSRSRFKIFIIDEVHMLSTSAFNALLKTLEEPPPHVKFIFATTEPHKLPVTILSRCQRFDFKKISSRQVTERLRHIVDAEGVAVSDAALALVARKGEGSMRDSLSVLDQVLAFCGDRIGDDDVTALLGVVDRRLLAETVQGVLERNPQGVLDAVRKVDHFGYSMRQFAQELIGQFRALTVVKVMNSPEEILDLSEAEMAEAREQAASPPLEDLQRHVSVLLRAEGEMAHATFPRVVLEMALVKMATLPPSIPAADIIERLKSLERSVPADRISAPAPRWEGKRPAVAPSAPAPPSAAPAAAPAVPAAKPAAPPTGNGGSWESFVAFVKEEKVRLGTVLEHGHPLSFTADRVEVAFPAGSFYLSTLQDADAAKALQELAARFFGKASPFAVREVLAADGTPPPTLHEKKKRDDHEQSSRLKQEAQNHPLVCAALEIFGGALEVEPRKENES